MRTANERRSKEMNNFKYPLEPLEDATLSTEGKGWPQLPYSLLPTPYSLPTGPHRV